MIVANYVAAGVLFCLGLFAVTSRRNLIKIVLGLSLMESSTYLLLVSMAYRNDSTAPVLAGLPGGRTQKDLVAGMWPIRCCRTSASPRWSSGWPSPRCS